MSSTPKMLSILRTSKSWYTGRTFQVTPQKFYQLYTIHAAKMDISSLCLYFVDRENQTDLQEDVEKVIRNTTNIKPFVYNVAFRKGSFQCVWSRIPGGLS